MLGVDGKPGEAKSCRSPFRHENNPSFAIYVAEEGCMTSPPARGGTRQTFAFSAGFHGKRSTATIEMAGTRKEPERTFSPTPDFVTLEPIRPVQGPGKGRKRGGWPDFEAPARRNRGDRKASRACRPRVSPSRRSEICSCAPIRERRAWIITDSQRRNAQARRLDGHLWAPSATKKHGRLPGMQSLADRTARGFALSGNCLGGRWAGSIGGVSPGVVLRRRGRMRRSR